MIGHSGFFKNHAENTAPMIGPGISIWWSVNSYATKWSSTCVTFEQTPSCKEGLNRYIQIPPNTSEYISWINHHHLSCLLKSPSTQLPSSYLTSLKVVYSFVQVGDLGYVDLWRRQLWASLLSLNAQFLNSTRCAVYRWNTVQTPW